MKLIAMFMAVLIAFYPVAVPYEDTAKPASSHSLLSEAVRCGRKRVKSADPDAVIQPEAVPFEETITEPEIAVSISEIAPEAAPAHEHIWIPVTETVHHDAVYQIIHHEALTERVWVEDKPAWDETYENTIIVAIHAFCKGCGIDLNEAGMTDEEYDEHDRQHILNGEDSSYYESPIYQTVTETVHHEAEGHYGDVGVQGAYDEAVLVSEAWDEEVIIGYVCVECGEVR